MAGSLFRRGDRRHHHRPGARVQSSPRGWYARLRHHSADVTVYLLSFSFTGIYWIDHHHMVDRLKRVDALILWANLGFLFCLSLLPFFTNYLVEKKLNSFSVAVYAASLIIDGLAFTLLSLAIVRHLRLGGHLYEPAEAAEQAAEQKKDVISILMYLLAIPLAFGRPYLALADVALVTLLWIIPTFDLRHLNLQSGKSDQPGNFPGNTLS